MAANYERQNDQLRGIRYQKAQIERIVEGIDFRDNCIITGGMDLIFENGAKIANRKILLEYVIKRLIMENNRPIIVFYKSPYLIRQILSWYRAMKIQRECSVISERVEINGIIQDSRCLAPFLGMEKEEIIYTVKMMSVCMHLSFDQYSEMFLEYLLNVIEHAGYEITC